VDGSKPCIFGKVINRTLWKVCFTAKSFSLFNIPRIQMVWIFWKY